MTFVIELENGKREIYSTTYLVEWGDGYDDEDTYPSLYATPCGMRGKRLYGCDHLECAQMIIEMGEASGALEFGAVAIVLGFICIIGAFATGDFFALVPGALFFIVAAFLHGQGIKGIEADLQKLKEFEQHGTIGGVKAKAVPHPLHRHY